MPDNRKEHLFRIRLGAIIFLLGFASPLLSFWVPKLSLPDGVEAMLIGLIIFGIPELLMLIALAVMGKEAWNLLQNKLKGYLSWVSPQRVSKTRYYLGVSIFSLCLIEGMVEIHSSIIQDFMGYNLGVFHWSMNILFALSFIIAGGEFWDKIRSLFVYNHSN